MSKVQHSNSLHFLSEQIGDFIQYWGFKKIHGIIWTHLYLSSTPLSAQELIQKLGVSKALISLSIKDLLHYQLILQTTESIDKKNKFYIANPDVFTVIRNVLETRETQMLERIQEGFTRFQENLPAQSNELPLDSTRVESLGRMITGANEALKSLLTLAAIDPGFLNDFMSRE
jgi:DNA-binding transcriptional regulator GbsR (MarR family)